MPTETQSLIEPVATTEGHRETWKKYGLLSPEDVNRMSEHESSSHSLVDGLIECRSISVLVGDSGLGKSPLAYQLGLAVASGVPFLGLGVQQGLVVYADFENGLYNGRALRDSIVAFLGLPSAPENFLSWYPESGALFDLPGVCRELHPKLLVVDSLRAFNPLFESTERAGEEMNRLHAAAYRNGVSILLIHHVKKPGPYGSPSLEKTDLMSWLNEAAGHRSIINQSDTRIGAAATTDEEAAMVLRWHRRLRGASGPVFLRRVLNDSGEPAGYRPMEGPELLSNSEQESAFLCIANRLYLRGGQAEVQPE